MNEFKQPGKATLYNRMNQLICIHDFRNLCKLKKLTRNETTYIISPAYPTWIVPNNELFPTN